ncbi:MAG: prepilin-type N-terminal cleavage/methylation domain-containing protein [Clostridiales bacterium]|nr:prepilin-type N-terminal cleavage/methylation domain-containing protein [Clostridiales bacterium]
MNNSKSAFSVIELVIVLAVIGILAAILIPVMSNIIQKANAKSALSDARNTLTNYVSYCELEKRSKNQSVIIVEKAGKYYVYGYFINENALIESIHNPYTSKSFGELENYLEDNEVIVTVGTNHADITDILPDKFENVKMYEGYLLQSIGEQILLNRNSLGLRIGDEATLFANILPQADSQPPIIWSSKDEKVATVSNGTVIGVALGETEITVQYGDISAICKVFVSEYIDFDGNMAELKNIIEDDNDGALFIRLTNDVMLEDYPDIFPIIIPQYKVVRVDFNDKMLSYGYSSSEYYIYSMFINNGGDIYFESTGTWEFGDVYVSSGDKSSIESKGFILENRNGGTVEIIDYINMSCTGSPGIPNNTIYNKDGRITFLGGSCSMYLNSVTDVDCSAIYNDVNGVLVINSNKNFSSNGTTIINYGTIEEIANAKIRGSLIGIKNFGLIEEISSGEIITAENGIAIDNIGSNAEIRLISGGIFGSNFNVHTIDSKNAIILRNNSKLGSITNGTFFGIDSIVCESDVKIGKGISGGKFSSEVPQNLLASGKFCAYNETIEMYEVE